MATSITAALVRARWPHLTSTAIVDNTLMATLITEADAELGNTGAALAAQRETAVKHLAAHKATMVLLANDTQGAATGPVVSASFLHRSESRANSSSSSATSPLAAEFETTAPGRALLVILRATQTIPRLIA